MEKCVCVCMCVCVCACVMVNGYNQSAHAGWIAQEKERARTRERERGNASPVHRTLNVQFSDSWLLHMKSKHLQSSFVHSAAQPATVVTLEELFAQGPLRSVIVLYTQLDG